MSDKRQIIERILAAWEKVPELRLGQFLECVKNDLSDWPTSKDLFFIADERLVKACEEFVRGK